VGLVIPDAAREAHRKAGELIQERRFVEAIAPAEAAARLCPEWAAPWWNLTVGYKHAGDWERTLEACERAIALDPDDAEGPHWNAGIAATALGLWPRARAAWAAVGITVPPGDGAIEMNIGPTPVRVSPAAGAEVVWCFRIDPCRARIESVPLPESERRYGDLLLHDGEARGRRRLGRRSIPVFDELALLEMSSFKTFEVVVRCGTEAELAETIERLHAEALGVEDWTSSVRLLCAKCSLGDEDHAHDADEAAQGWMAERRLGVAARDEADMHPLRRGLFGWRSDVLSVRRVL
jgi:tetratricopeptide (TPR) repeat protein